MGTILVFFAPKQGFLHFGAEFLAKLELLGFKTQETKKNPCVLRQKKTRKNQNGKETKIRVFAEESPEPKTGTA